MSKADESAAVIKSVVEEVAQIVSEMAGIQLGSRQHSMIENRLKSRMLRLKLESFPEYLKYLRAHKESESQALLSLMTTHHTYFFREFAHFEYLLNKGLPTLVALARTRPDKKIKVWSAASSRGQEVYSLAMFFDFHLKHVAPDVDFEIWGSDVDPKSVEFAQNGVYRFDELKQSPAMYVDGNWARGKDDIKDFVKVKSHLKSKCHFTTVNLLKPKDFLTGREFDVVFCRNVFIYFSTEQIAQISKDILKHLHPQGMYVLGVSESLNGLGLEVDLAGSSIYHHKLKPSAPKVPAATLAQAKVPSRTLEVLCVDDSPTIHALLSKILTSDSGFKIKAKAMNGMEALEKLKTEKFDIITLDLHMPELDGVGFLKQYGGDKTPVVVLSSINRDDPSIAQQALKLGAKDYVEKPSLENLAQAGNEIRSKIKMVIQNSQSASGTSSASATSAPIGGSVRPATTKSSGRKKVLIVDDSVTIRKLLKDVLSSDPYFEVVAEAEKPSLVEGLIQTHKPDLITLDIHMPEMDGVTLLKRIHSKYLIPTVMISSISKEEGPQVLQALEIGAVDYIQKPEMSKLRQETPHILERLKIASQVKLSTQKRQVRKAAKLTGQNSIILLGASTGGTEALRVVMQGLPSEIPPILVVQHIPPVFSAAFADRLNSLMPFSVKEAVDGDLVQPNQVLIAPGGKQMGVKILNGKLVITIKDDAPVNRHKPSVDYMFKSVKDAGVENIVAAVLTGMGADGARELKGLRNVGARTIAQDQETSVVYGMPKEAKEMGGAEFVLPIDAVAEKLIVLSNEFKHKTKKVA